MFMQMQPIDYVHVLIHRQQESVLVSASEVSSTARNTFYTGQLLLRHPLCGIGAHCAVNTLIEGGL